MSDATVKQQARVAPKPAPKRGVAPDYMSHVVLHTRDVPRMVDWWSKVLNARSMYDDFPAAQDDRGIARVSVDFITFDEEHHRLAFMNIDGLTGGGPTPGPSDTTPSSLHHIAFTYRSLGDLVQNWKYLQSVGIEPIYTLHHGPTISCYYMDPDGNRAELQIDAFETREALDEWFKSGAFAEHYGAGPTFDFAKLAERYDAGDDEAWLKSNDGFIRKYADPVRKTSPSSRPK